MNSITSVISLNRRGSVEFFLHNLQFYSIYSIERFVATFILLSWDNFTKVHTHLLLASANTLCILIGFFHMKKSAKVCVVLVVNSEYLFPLLYTSLLFFLSCKLLLYHSIARLLTWGGSFSGLVTFLSFITHVSYLFFFYLLDITVECSIIPFMYWLCNFESQISSKHPIISTTSVYKV